jgi:uncharacterized protein (DUF1501 family)
MNRRKFLQRSALATAGSWLIPGFLKAFEQQHLHQPLAGNRKLVIIQLSGGNDGLNTVVPYQDDVYYQLRPGLGIEKSKVLTINEEQGFNPALTGLKNLYDQGWVSVVNSVGYPNPDRSHFRSMDIWQTASESDQYLTTGWIGRYLDAACAGTCVPYHALEVDDTLSLAMKGEKVKALAVQNPKKLYDNAHQAFLGKIQNARPEHEPENVSYLYKTMSETISSAGYLYEKSKIYKSKTTYPNTELGKKLLTVSELIGSGVETSVFYVSISGFDTHVGQAAKQGRLLQEYAEAVEIFIRDLKSLNRLDETLVMTFSEFGRRVAQNGSGGTDHGTANNLFLIGGKLAKPGFFNPAPNLTDLDEGDLKYQIDFRNIYATLLQNWLGIEDKTVLGKGFEKLGLV